MQPNTGWNITVFDKTSHIEMGHTFNTTFSADRLFTRQYINIKLNTGKHMVIRNYKRKRKWKKKVRNGEILLSATKFSDKQTHLTDSNK